MKTDLTIRCACGVEHLDIDLFLDMDEEDGYMSFSSIFGPRRSWRERFKVVWLILRGKSYYFDELMLDREKLTQLRDFLTENLSSNKDMTTVQKVLRDMLGTFEIETTDGFIAEYEIAVKTAFINDAKEFK